MVSASSDKPTAEIGRMTFKDELKRSVLLDINCQADDTPESKTADSYKMHFDNFDVKVLSPNSGYKFLHTLFSFSLRRAAFGVIFIDE